MENNTTTWPNAATETVAAQMRRATLIHKNALIAASRLEQEPFFDQVAKAAIDVDFVDVDIEALWDHYLAKLDRARANL